MWLHHVGIAVSDLDRSIAFYTRHFGFQVAERASFEGAALAFLTLEDGARLELAAEGRPAGPPASHVALGATDLDRLAARLRAQGVAVTEPAPLWNGGRTAFCDGPDGELIELIEWPRA